MRSQMLIPLPENTGERLDRYLSEKLNVARSQIQNWIDCGLVRVSGSREQRTIDFAPATRSKLQFEPAPAEPRPQAIRLDILYEDSDLLVINKPKGMVVHPAAGNPDGTLVNALLARCGEPLGHRRKTRPGIVHRLDKDTSGLLVVAKNNAAHKALPRR